MHPVRSLRRQMPKQGYQGLKPIGAVAQMTKLFIVNVMINGQRLLFFRDKCCRLP